MSSRALPNISRANMYVFTWIAEYVEKQLSVLSGRSAIVLLLVGLVADLLTRRRIPSHASLYMIYTFAPTEKKTPLPYPPPLRPETAGG